ncbi:MAG: alanine--tRNA ligase [Deltaproteobacteria bacterium]|nr:alanine--tRNA ligase [Deltaproteobacteria bacterium]MBN2670623.1 alanine--tRNA ligase [Deltaproteobacteria bacterium]
MTKSTSEIRQAFLDYFESKSHRVLPSGALVPAQDPTLMFANAGMVQFKNVFIGEQKKPAPRATTVQKCIRISGKHNDLENVGRTSRHHTFFEMLGNFSFGDYFKQDACKFGWEFLTDVLKFPKEKLWVSIFKGDENAPRDAEAFDIWTKEIGVAPDRVLEGDAKDNFWSMGDTGPCGPCSEIMYDRGEGFGEACLENGERFFEVWNLVFMQYMVETPGAAMKPLPAPCIDTGAGLERIVSILQEVDSNYDIDLFQPLIATAADAAQKQYGADPEDDVSMRVIADHARMAAHLISEGIFPEKTGREYVLRRVMRRAIRHGHRLGINDLFFYKVTDKVVDEMKSAYPELAERRELIEKVCRQEEKQFRQTLSRGLELLSGNTDWIEQDGQKLLPGDIAFDLSATYGFPLDLVEVIGEEQGFSVDLDGYQQAETKHKVASGAGKIGEQAAGKAHLHILEAAGRTVFLGYDMASCNAKVVGLVVAGESAQHASAGVQVEIVLDQTPFYGESGGQVGDTGTLSFNGGNATITNTTKPVDGLFVHTAVLNGASLSVGDAVEAIVNMQRRKAISRHHTATHLLHYAIRTVLGAHATQKGSRVSAESLRFDFTHFEALTPAQLAEVEKIVSTLIIENSPVNTDVTSYADAKKTGAMALFEENYGDEVRLVSVGDASKELCGGIHASRSGDLGPFYILSEGGIAAGVRRIEAVCGEAAIAYAAEQKQLLHQAAAILKTNPAELVGKVEKSVAREKELNREIEKLKRELAGGGADLLEQVKDIGGVKVLGAALSVGDPAAMRDSADTLRQKLGSGVVCLTGDNNGKAAIVIAVTKDLTDRLQAGTLIREVAAVVGGKGGGRPDMAQAGGPSADKIKDAANTIYDLVKQAVG